MSSELGAGGLDLNPAKCATLSIEIDGKAKRWVVNPNARFTIGDRMIKALSAEESYKYLGMQVLEAQNFFAW